MVSRRGLGAGGVRCHGPRQLWAVPARGFGWVFPLHLLLTFAQKQKKRYHALPVPLVRVRGGGSVGCYWCRLLYTGNLTGQSVSGTLAALHLCTCGIGTRVSYGSNTCGSTDSQAPPAPAKGKAAAGKTVKRMFTQAA